MYCRLEHTAIIAKLTATPRTMSKTSTPADMKPNEQGKKRKEKEPVDNIKASVVDHDYVSSETYEGDQDADLTSLPLSAPETPVKPKEKKKKGEISLADLQDNIIATVNERADNLEGMITKNSISIEALKRSIDFAFAEVEILKTDMREVKNASERYNQQIAALQTKLSESERYGRRWNLRLHGVPENNPEDIKAKVINICCAMIPDSQQKIRDDIDIVHRLGRHQGNLNRPRTTIIRFTNRSTRDLLWRVAKRSEYLKNNKLRFTEDLTAEDKATRNKLWPIIEAAKKEGKKAHFAGTRVIIDGREIRPEQLDRFLMDTSSAGATPTT